MSTQLPGEELVEKGLTDLAAGTETEESLLISIGAPRLRRLGIALPALVDLPDQPEMRLHQLIAKSEFRDSHSRYNSLLRRLVSFERAAEREQWSRRRREAARD